jgi:hypothetical protein
MLFIFLQPQDHTSTAMITPAQVQYLYDKYLELIQLETTDFGVKPTEVRHLIGRLGEFYCALRVGGTLTHVTNQHGFDVVCARGRRISVKTTAQITGFVPITKASLKKADDLMIIQFRDGKLSTIYYGPIALAAKAARYYEQVGKYELDIVKARRLTGSVATDDI